MTGLRKTIAILSVLAWALGLPGGAIAQSSNNPAAGRLLLEGRRLQSEGDLAGALREFQLLAERFPESLQAREALWLIAQGKAQEGDRNGARQTAVDLASRFPSSPYAADAYLLQARLLLQGFPTPAEVEEASTLFKRIPLLFGRDDFPKLPARHEARFLRGDLDLDLGEMGTAAAAFVGAIEDEPAASWTSRARVGLGKTLLIEGDWVSATDILQRAVAASEESGRADADPASAGLARRLLTGIHRLALLPASGQPSWNSARILSVPGATLKRPIAVAANLADHVVIVDRAGLVVEIGPGGAAVASRAAKDSGKPWWGKDRAYFGDDGTLRRMTDTWGANLSVPKKGKKEPLKSVGAGASGALGQWYLLDSGAKRVQVFVPRGKFLSTLMEGDPVDLAQDLQGKIYVLDRKARKVNRYLSNGRSDGVAASGNWRKPEAVAVDILGRVYILDRDNATINIFGLQGGKVQTIGPQLPGGIELRNPVDLTVDASGRLYIADSRLQAVVIVE